MPTTDPNARARWPLLPGARHYQLESSYQQYLAAHESYQPSSTLGQAATAAAMLTTTAAVMPWALLTAGMRGASGQGSVAAAAAEGVADTMHGAMRATWWLHDAALEPLLGRSGCLNGDAAQ